METPLDNLLNEMQVLQHTMQAFGQQVISSPGMGSVILNLNRHQLNAGTRPDGSAITPDYTPFTKFLKAEEGRDPDIVTLRDTGEFHADLRVEFTDDEARISDVNEKAQKLIAKYGGGDDSELFGLTDESEGRVTELLLPVFEGHARAVILPQLLER